MTAEDSPSVPRLLVSVRNREEAEAALAGGCDILDVKEPDYGPLGMARRSVIADVAARAARDGVICTAACGEAVEFAGQTGAVRRFETGQHSAAPGVHWYKLGPASLSGFSDWQGVWRNAWCSADALFARDAAGPAAGGPGAVAVIYADWKSASAPPPHQILDAVAAGPAFDGDDGDIADTPFGGVLLDTYDKQSGGLFDCLSAEELREIVARVRELRVGAASGCADAVGHGDVTRSVLEGGSRMFVALAGRLKIEDLPRLKELLPDVVAIRSAACRHQDRQRAVDADGTRQFHTALVRQFRPADGGHVEAVPPTPALTEAD